MKYRRQQKAMDETRLSNSDRGVIRRQAALISTCSTPFAHTCILFSAGLCSFYPYTKKIACSLSDSVALFDPRSGTASFHPAEPSKAWTRRSFTIKMIHPMYVTSETEIEREQEWEKTSDQQRNGNENETTICRCTMKCIYLTARYTVTCA